MKVDKATKEEVTNDTTAEQVVPADDIGPAQAKERASRFRALVLIGVAAAFCAALMPHITKPSVTSKLAEVEHPVALPPQWLPVLLVSWQQLWPKLLAAPPVEPDFEKVRQHVCKSRHRIKVTGIDKLGVNTSCMRDAFRCPDLPPLQSAKVCDFQDDMHLGSWDGLGHVGSTLFAALARQMEDGRLRQRSTYFSEAVTTRAAHLRGWEGLQSNTSLYCHQSQAPDNRCTPESLFSHQLECYLVPPLDEWFGLTTPGLTTPNCTEPFDAGVAVSHRASPLKGGELEYHTQGATGAQEKLRLRYWAVHSALRKHVTCGFDHDSALKVSLHVRLGDLIRPSAANRSEITDKQKHKRDKNFADRATVSVRDICDVLLLLDDVAAALGSRPAPRRVHVLVVSDSPFDELVTAVEAGCAEVRFHRKRVYSDGIAMHVVARLEMRGGGEERLGEVDFLQGGHPLLGLHCLAAADVLPRSKSNFGEFAARFSRGRVVVPPACRRSEADSQLSRCGPKATDAFLLSAGEASCRPLCHLRAVRNASEAIRSTKPVTNGSWERTSR